MELTENLRKIIVDLEPSEWHGYGTETVWGENLRGEIYRIKNIPFYAKDLSLNDEVLVEVRDGRNYLRFISKRGGHSTYRIFLGEDTTDADFQDCWNNLQNIGCSYEKGVGRLLSVDVPPDTNIYEAFRFLEIGETRGVWDFEEGHCGHPLSRM